MKENGRKQISRRAVPAPAGCPTLRAFCAGGWDRKSHPYSVPNEYGPITQHDHEPSSRWYSIVLCYVCARHVPSSHSRAFVQSAGLGCAPAKHALWTSHHALLPESKPRRLQEQPVGLWSSLPRQAMHRLASALPRFFPVIPFDLLSTGFFRPRSRPPVRFCARRVSFVTTVTRIYQFSIDCAYFPELVPG